MERYTIENEILKVGINQKGAELASIVKKEIGKEYIWQADPTYWGRHSCILFPIIGKLYEGKYFVKGQEYEMGQHGFARDRLFTVTEQISDKITCRYESTEEDKILYPFVFAINMVYELVGNTLSITYEVENHAGETMTFSLGGHPAFNCPLNEGEKRSDYLLRFEEVETAESFILNANGVFDGKTQKVFSGNTDISITDDLFDKDALVFKRLISNKVTLINGNQAPVLTFDFTGFPYLGIWSKNRQSPYVCIEPWHGIADNEFGQEDFFEKEGNEYLEAEKSFSCTHKVTIY